jgi:hypothetical protein
MTQSGFEIIDTTDSNVVDLGICGNKHLKTPGLKEKRDWMAKRKKEGLRIKTLWSEEAGNQGMIEYIPGKYCWRPVSAPDYLFIHCLFVGFRKEFKGRGLASSLLRICWEDAQASGFRGVAAVTRKGSFMSGKEIFERNGFRVVDSAPPDFDLVVRKTDPDADDPRFLRNWENMPAEYGEGLFIIKADQCPYTVKNVQEIADTARGKYGVRANVIILKTHGEAQRSFNPFGTFTMLYNGKIIAWHPISNRRFMNIMDRIV